MNRLLLVLCLLIIPVSAFPFQNEPDGFRGVPWDSSMDRIAGIRPLGKPAGSMQGYMKMDENFLQDGITLSDITYRADSGRFVEAVNQFDCAQYGALRESLTKNFGAASARAHNVKSMIWRGTVTTIILAPAPAATGKSPAPNGEPLLCTLTYSSTASLKKSAPRQ